MVENKQIICIVSGGADSVVMLHKAVKELGKENVNVLSFDYGSKHNKAEIPMAKWQCKQLGVNHKIIPLDFVKKYFKSDLLKNGGAIPEGHYAANNMKSTVVPFRNGIMLSIASGCAESVGASEVWLGSHLGDRAQYPDCTVEFIQTMNNAVELGTDKHIKIVSPYNDKLKWDVLKEGLDMGIDFNHTHSCYKGKKIPCGKCGTCVERTESFFRNGEVDPKYINEKSWNKAVEFMKKEVEQFDKEHIVEVKA